MDYILREVLGHTASILLGGIALALIFRLFKFNTKIWLNAFIITTILTLFDISSNYLVNFLYIPGSLTGFIQIFFIYLLALFLINRLLKTDIQQTLVVGTSGFIMIVLIDVALVYLLF